MGRLQAVIRGSPDGGAKGFLFGQTHLPQRQPLGPLWGTRTHCQPAPIQ